MQGTIVGIDYSIVSPGICILKDNEYKYIAFKRKPKLSKREVVEYGLLIKAGVEILGCLRPLDKKDEYNKTCDAELLSKSTLYAIKKYEPEVICLEGFAYAAKGSSILDLAGYQYLLRKDIIFDLKIKPIIYPPTKIKKIAGNGRMTKDSMINKWLKNEHKDPILEDNLLRKAVLENKESFLLKNGSYMQPLTDLVDAYWITRTYLKENL